MAEVLFVFVFVFVVPLFSETSTWQRRNRHLQLASREHRRAYSMVRRLFHGRIVTMQIGEVHPTGTVALSEGDVLSSSHFVRVLRDAGSHAGGPLTMSMGF